MRRLTLLVALMIPLVGVTLAHAPSAVACTPPLCSFGSCDFTFERPWIDPNTFEFDPGLVGVECSVDDPGDP